MKILLLFYIVDRRLVHPGRPLEYKEERKMYKASTAIVRNSYLTHKLFYMIVFTQAETSLLDITKYVLILYIAV